ncbi:BTB/POZ domain-containing protein 9-like isoform X3 [Zophobas morio]|uniref:BTB/POZ domain-containing protein 9-like isoform X3 n=1 Tax=Zophobas morio TaxID=2755281 RepID=UPI003082F6AB
MSPYYLKETFSDIQLILSDKTIHAHKIVLAARCKYFESLLLQDPKQTQIELMNASSKALETILYYIYTGTVIIASLDENYVSHILKLAHEYSLKTLVQTINEEMVSIVDLSNVCFFLNIANAHDMDELKEICHTLIDRHVSQTYEYNFFNDLTQKSMVNMLKRDAFPVEEIDVFKIAANWCKINGDLDNLVIECVRFPCLTRNEILNLVRPSKVVDNEKLLDVLSTIENNGTKETQRHVSEKFVVKNLVTGEYNVKVISGLNTTMLFEETKNGEDGAYHNEDNKNGINVDLAGVKCFNHITMNIRDTSPGSFTTHLYLNQPYMISRIKVTLQFYKSISSIETSSDWSHREKVELPKDKNLLLRFNKRIVTDMRIIGQLSPNETANDYKQFLEDLECL